MTTVKRQRKILEEDIIAKKKTNASQVEEADAASMAERILTGQAKAPKDRFDGKFRKAVRSITTPKPHEMAFSRHVYRSRMVHIQ